MMRPTADKQPGVRPTWSLWRPLAMGLISIICLCFLLSYYRIGSDAVNALVSRANSGELSDADDSISEFTEKSDSK